MCPCGPCDRAQSVNFESQPLRRHAGLSSQDRVGPACCICAAIERPCLGLWLEFKFLSSHYFRLYPFARLHKSAAEPPVVSFDELCES